MGHHRVHRIHFLIGGRRLLPGQLQAPVGPEHPQHRHARQHRRAVEWQAVSRGVHAGRDERPERLADQGGRLVGAERRPALRDGRRRDRQRHEAGLQHRGPDGDDAHRGHWRTGVDPSCEHHRADNPADQTEDHNRALAQELHNLAQKEELDDEHEKPCLDAHLAEAIRAEAVQVVEQQGDAGQEHAVAQVDHHVEQDELPEPCFSHEAFERLEHRLVLLFLGHGRASQHPEQRLLHARLGLLVGKGQVSDGQRDEDGARRNGGDTRVPAVPEGAVQRTAHKLSQAVEDGQVAQGSWQPARVHHVGDEHDEGGPRPRGEEKVEGLDADQLPQAGGEECGALQEDCGGEARQAGDLPPDAV
mmetsp:Transcript_77703/g.219731  ORF Transcript_77703/g.219731 Transcript_77703/m.219731 type:complete len:360 (+) Transcript_77703:380-1459(+)